MQKERKFKYYRIEKCRKCLTWAFFMPLSKSRDRRLPSADPGSGDPVRRKSKMSRRESHSEPTAAVVVTLQDLNINTPKWHCFQKQPNFLNERKPGCKSVQRVSRVVLGSTKRSKSGLRRCSWAGEFPTSAQLFPIKTELLLIRFSRHSSPSSHRVHPLHVARVGQLRGERSALCGLYARRLAAEVSDASALPDAGSRRGAATS